MDAFLKEDRAKDLQNLDLFVDDLPDQRSLGVRWNIMSDIFTFYAPETDRPYTRRGVLSTVNSLFDPLGFLAPVTIRGRLLLRELSRHGSDWDTNLPESMHEQWVQWQSSLQCLRGIQIPRIYSAIPPSNALHIELCIFSDASVNAIAAVAYLKFLSHDKQIDVGFVLGKARLAPRPELTVPRLELCAAVLAVEIAEVVSEEIDFQLNSTSFYTDSKVVLGYIHNQSRRFSVYVNNRVQRIRQSSKPEQWHYVPTDQNPADHGSRSISASKLSSSTWITGPRFLRLPLKKIPEEQNKFDLINPESDVDIRPEVNSLSTYASESHLSSKRWERMIGVVRHILDSMLLQSGRVRLTHEVLTTLMAEVITIINARPLVPVSSDPEHPNVLTPSMLLTQKIGTPFLSQSNFGTGEMLRHQWKRVQYLAEEFWSRWRTEYLSTLQTRQKWQNKRPDIKEGDVVLLKEKQVRRNEWPMGIIMKAVPSKDGLIRKVEIKIVQQGATKILYRPISELVFLLSPD
ncbi:uncharacterized protein LOC114659410 [Erpetoichthys calabaricus]|uniref:uncharacterized protein LOC114659410 n=1 Tax=Erpetoichthys calabaricus TaxID=27687 RepID=UPI0022346CB7|nr:uncharacterized protein LOC114659410 [Erpetoichthys calabaricus]XP_051788796.1 uncharacterized protein LOC114659410 [Erpetoichthys calabaricus]